VRFVDGLVSEVIPFVEQRVLGLYENDAAPVGLYKLNPVVTHHSLKAPAFNPRA
jgi:hypothetical protein